MSRTPDAFDAAFDARLADERALEDGDVDDAFAASWARAERAWSATGPLGDEAHRARVCAARARKDAATRATTSTTDGRDATTRARRRTRATATTKARTTTMTIDAYRRAWRALERAATKKKGRTLRLGAYPFVEDAMLTPATALGTFLTSDAPARDARARLRAEMVRWHPDKFAKYAALAREKDADVVAARVNAMSQAVREAFRAFKT